MWQDPSIANADVIGRIPLEKDCSSSDVDFLKNTLCQPSLLTHNIVRWVSQINRDDLVRADHGSLATFRQPKFMHVHGRQAVPCLHGSHDAVVGVNDETYTEEVAFLLITNDHTQVIGAVVRADMEVLRGVGTGDSITVPHQVAELVVDVRTGCRCLVVWRDEYVAVREAILDGNVECWCPGMRTLLSREWSISYLSDFATYRLED
jgi:hypothetical protein